MSGICFAPGAGAQGAAEALRALSGRLADDTPVMALGGHAGDGRAAFASAAILDLFGAGALPALADAIAGQGAAEGSGEAAARLRRLSETLPVGGPARLERLRFSDAGAQQIVTFLCRRLSVAGAPPLFVAAALDLAPARERAGPSPAPAAPEPGPPRRQALPAAQRFVWRTDANGRIVEAGAALCEALRQGLGAAPADLAGRGLADALARFDPQNAARLAEALERRAGFRGLEIAIPASAPAGACAIALAATPVLERGRFAGFRGFGVIRFAARPAHMKTTQADDRPAAPAEPGLRQAPARAVDAELRHYQREARELAAILDTATDGVAVLDADGRIKALNRSAEALFGFDKAEVSGEAFTILLAPESRARAESYFDGLKSNAVAAMLNDGREILGLTRQGGTIPLFMTLGRIGAGEGEPRYCALLRDMTHWKTVESELDEARREAERASALKSDFLARISHEIRTPLNAILGFAEVIMDERFGPIGNARYKEYLKDIRSSGALVLSLVNDLLDLSKIESGKMELAFESVDANRSVVECVSIMQPQASAAGVVLRPSLAPQLPHIFADERSLRQIVLNLLSNAIKFTQGGGQVIVSTALTDENCAALRIRDTGVGMSDADLEIALEPFRQVGGARASGGTGLGLPLTKALVEANRATFSIRSKPDEGTLVEVVFPPARVVANRV